MPLTDGSGGVELKHYLFKVDYGVDSLLDFNLFIILFNHLHVMDGGEGGIRTHGPRKESLDFESSPFDHSGTSPIIGGGFAP